MDVKPQTNTNMNKLTHYQKYGESVKKWHKDHPNYRKDTMREAYQNSPEVRAIKLAKVKLYQKLKKEGDKIKVIPNFIIVE